MLARRGVRVSLGAQSFGAAQLAVLERRATPDQVRAAAERLRAAGRRQSLARPALRRPRAWGEPSSTAISTRRSRSSPSTSPATSWRPSRGRASPTGTAPSWHGRPSCWRTTTSTSSSASRRAGYRWYETANFCRDDRRARHNLAYWTGRDYLGIGIGAVSTLGLERRTNRPSLAGFVDALERAPRRRGRSSSSRPAERARERLMLGLRLDEPLAIAGLRTRSTRKGWRAWRPSG